jgi:hypothetical protein
MPHDHFVADSLNNRLTHGEYIPVSSAIRETSLSSRFDWPTLFVLH